MNDARQGRCADAEKALSRALEIADDHNHRSRANSVERWRTTLDEARRRQVGGTTHHRAHPA